MQILVWGASAEAAWLTARFHQLGYETTWLANDTIAADISRFAGLNLVSPQRKTQLKQLHILTNISEALKPLPAWIVLAMPNWALNAAVLQLATSIPKAQCPPILTLQHGMGAIEKIGAFFDQDRITQGILTRNFQWPTLPDGTRAYETVVSDGLGGIALTDSPHALKMAHMLALVGFGKVPIHDQVALRWSDILWQIQANALSTLLDIDPAAVYENPRLFEIEYAQLREAVRVIDHLRIKLLPLPSVNIPRLAWQIRTIPKQKLRTILAKNKPSASLRDDLVYKTGRSDAAYLNGTIASFAYDHRLPAPVNHILALSVTDIAEGRAQWQQFHGNPDYLETLLRIASRHVPSRK